MNKTAKGFFLGFVYRILASLGQPVVGGIEREGLSHVSTSSGEFPGKFLHSVWVFARHLCTYVSILNSNLWDFMKMALLA